MGTRAKQPAAPQKREMAIALLVVGLVAGFAGGILAGWALFHSPRPTTPPAAASLPPQAMALGQRITELKEAVRVDPRNLRAWVELGNAYFDSNQPRPAIEVYARALEMDPKNPDVRTDMGIMYRALKEFDRAVAEFRQASLDGPTHVNSRYNLGVVLRHDKGDLKGAIEAWEDFLRVEPKGERADKVRSEIEAMGRTLGAGAR